MIEFKYRDPKKVTTKEKYREYILSETKERNRRHRRCLEILGIKVEERIPKGKPSVLKYYNMHGENVATFDNMNSFDEESEEISSELIPFERTIDLKDGRTIVISDDFDYRLENGDYQIFDTTVSVYNTEDMSKEEPRPIVTATYHTTAEDVCPAMEVESKGVYFIASDGCISFRIAQDRRSRELDYDGELAKYVEVVSGDGNDRARGVVEIIKHDGRYYLRAGHGDNPVVKDITESEITPSLRSKGIITSGRAKELINKAIDLIALRLGHKNDFRNSILNRFRGMSYYLSEDNKYINEDIEALVNYVKVGRLNFGEKDSLFVESAPSKLTHEK